MQLAQIKTSSPVSFPFEKISGTSEFSSHSHDSILTGIQLELSCQDDYGKCYENVRSIIGSHFHCQFHFEVQKSCIILKVLPKEYCKVNGGMMLTTAGSILGDLVASEIQILSMNPLFE